MENQEQQLKETKAAPSHKNYSNRKRNAMLKLHAQPLYPRLAIVLLVCLLVLTCVLTVAEIFRSRTLWESGILLRNVVTAGLGIWSLYAVPLVLVCLLGMRWNPLRNRCRTSARPPCNPPSKPNLCWLHYLKSGRHFALGYFIPDCSIITQIPRF